jgi:hypothetical protein
MMAKLDSQIIKVRSLLNHNLKLHQVSTMTRQSLADNAALPKTGLKAKKHINSEEK